MSQDITRPTINCLKCLLAGIQRPAIRQMRATGEPACAVHALEGLPTAYEQKDIGRNDPCHCGSGLKYKKCHGTAAALMEAKQVKIQFAKPE